MYIKLCCCWLYYLRRRLASGEGIVSLGVTKSVSVSAEPRLHAALVSAAKVMRCIQCCQVLFFLYVVTFIIIISQRKPSTQIFPAATSSNHWHLRLWVHSPLSASTTAFVTDLGRRLSQSTDDSRETAFLFQRLSVAIQRFHSVLIPETFDFSDGQPEL